MVSESKPHMVCAIHDNGAVQKLNIHQVLAANLKKWREERDITQKDLAGKAGMAQSHISRIERQEMPTGPTVEKLNDLAYVLGLQAWELLTSSDAMRRSAMERAMGFADPIPTPEPPRPSKQAAHQQRKRKVPK